MLAERVRPPAPPVRAGLRWQAWTIAAVMGGVIWLDQVTKAWAWRHLTDVHINAGGDMLVGPGMGAWFSNRALGAVCDVVDAVLLMTAALLLARRHRPAGVLVSSALVLAGWSSNLLDRLGLHYWTAPGSVRGVVDFVPVDGRYWNLADGVIVVGSVLLAVSLVVAGLRALVGPRRRMLDVVRRPLAGPRARAAMLVGLSATGVLAVVGAVAYGGVDAPARLLAAGR